MSVLHVRESTAAAHSSRGDDGPRTAPGFDPRRYVARPEEAHVLALLERSGGVQIVAPYRAGKSWFVQALARREDAPLGRLAVVSLVFDTRRASLADESLFRDVAFAIADAASADRETVERAWASSDGVDAKLTQVIEAAAERAQGRLTLSFTGSDELDGSVAGRHLASMLHGWALQATRPFAGLWSRVRFVLERRARAEVGGASPEGPYAAVALADLGAEQIAELVRITGARVDPELLARVVGGHAELLDRATSAIAAGALDPLDLERPGAFELPAFLGYFEALQAQINERKLGAPIAAFLSGQRDFDDATRASFDRFGVWLEDPSRGARVRYPLYGAFFEARYGTA